MDLTVDVIDYLPEEHARILSDLGQRLPPARSRLHRTAGDRLHARRCARIVRASVARGLDALEVCRRLTFFFAATTEVLEEVAKFRAARRLWSELVLERFGVADEKARALRFHCQTAGSLLTSQEPENNLARIALQALAAILGGCQSLHTNAYDEAIGLPGERSAQLAAATQQMLAYRNRHRQHG